MGRRAAAAIAMCVVCGSAAAARADDGDGDDDDAWTRGHVELDGGVASASGVADGAPSSGRTLQLGVGVRSDRHAVRLEYALGIAELDASGATIAGASHELTVRVREALGVVLGRSGDGKRGEAWIELGGGAQWVPWPAGDARARPMVSLGVGTDLATDVFDDSDDPLGRRYVGVRFGVAVTAAPRDSALTTARCVGASACPSGAPGGVDLAVIVTAGFVVGR